MASTTLPGAAARLRRVDLRVVLGLVLLLAGVLGALGVIRQAGARTPVLVAARPVQAGDVISEGDVRVAEIGLGQGVASLPVGDRERVIGRVASVPLAEGQLLAPGLIAERPPLGPGEAAMSIAVAPEHAAGGAIQPGQQVAVVATANPGRPEARSAVLFDAVRVLAVTAPREDRAETKLTVTLALRPTQVSKLATVASGGGIDLVLLPGPPPREGTQQP